MKKEVQRWVVGLIFIVAVATIWIAASFLVQSVVDAGVSPFIITYICNSLFIVYIPLVEVSRYLEDYAEDWCFWKKRTSEISQELDDSEEVILLGRNGLGKQMNHLKVSGSVSEEEINQHGMHIDPVQAVESCELEKALSAEVMVEGKPGEGLDAKGRWTRMRVAKVSLLVCPFWFLAQLTFNLSLKYTTVTSNTILSTASSLFTFLFALAFLGEKFTWVKLASVLLCMGGTIIVSLGDSETGSSVINSNPVLGDFLSLMSSGFYAVYITLIGKKLASDEDKGGQVSMAQFLGFLGLFNLIIFLPVALVLNFMELEPLYSLTWKQYGLVVGKGLLDNVLSDYLWAKAVLMTTTTVATAGLTIQVPLAAVVDSIIGNAPNVMDYIGAALVMLGFAGINIPSDVFMQSKETSVELESEIDDQGRILSVSKDSTGTST